MNILRFYQTPPDLFSNLVYALTLLEFETRTLSSSICIHAKICHSERSEESFSQPCPV